MRVLFQIGDKIIASDVDGTIYIWNYSEEVFSTSTILFNHA